MATRLHKLMAALDMQKDPAFDDHKRFVKSFMAHAKQFDFGDEDKAMPMESKQPLYDYSKELINHGLFKLPYEATYICTSVTNKEGAAKGKRSDDCYLFSQVENDKIIGLQFGLVTQFNIIAFVHLVEIDLKKQNVRCISSLAFRSDESLGAYYYEKPHKDFMIESSEWIFSTLLTYIGLLNSKSVEIKAVASNGSVNRRRAKEGKPPIGEIYEVHLKLNGQRYSIDGRPLGSHASPRAHWRRGHIRRLASGEITNVKPCLVAFTGNENVPEQIYKVTA